MKQFLLKVLMAGGLFTIIAGSLTIIAYREELKSLKTELTCQPAIVAAAFGDSHVERGFDTNELPWLANFGRSAMPFSATAQKVKLAVELNPQLRLVIIDVWPWSLLSSLEVPYEIANRPAHPGIALLEMRSRELMPPLGDGFRLRFSNGVLKPGLERALGLETRRNPIAGEFIPTDICMKSNKWSKIETYLSDHVTDIAQTSSGGEIILDDLLSWLAERHVRAVLTTAPIYKWKWEYNHTPRAKEFFKTHMLEISKRHGVPWFNWIHEYSDNQEYWADCDHLNREGAKRFSKEKLSALKAYAEDPGPTTRK